MALRKRTKKLNMPEFNVNVTALMDVLVVLLFFLIKSFTVSSATLTPPDDIRLPTSVESKEVQETVTVSLSQKEIRVGNQTVLRMQNGKFSKKDIGPDRRTLIPLKTVLKKEYQKRKELFESAGDLSEHLPPGKILIQADHKLPYKILKYLFYTVAISGYTDYQFVVKDE